MKTLYIISKGMGKVSDQKLLEMERNNEIPRFSLLEKKLQTDLLDERFLKDKTSKFRRYIYSWIPTSLAQLSEALFSYKKYDVILSQFERVSFPLAIIMRIFNMKKPHVLIISRITSIDPDRSKIKMRFVKMIKNSVSLFLIWSSNQRKIAIEQLGVDPSKIILLKRGTDQKFWKPQPAQTDMISSAGMEARDYPTLVEALRPLSIPCHIAVGATRGELFDTVKRLYRIEDMPEHISVGRKSYEELRDIYARSRFTVVPLMESDSDNGLTTILESMAMGKPVIVSKTEGQIDVVEDGVTGVYVPQGDPEALRSTILELWNDPERCEEMGMAARKYIEENHNLEQFANEIKTEVEKLVYSTVPDSSLQLDRV